MPLPSDPNTPWPPTSWQPIHQSIAEADAWYIGTPDSLEGFYGGGNTASRPSDRKQTTAAKVMQKFWGRRSGDDCTDRQRLHLPAAADIAQKSADLLFGETPRLVIPEAHEENADSEALATEARLEELIEDDGIPGLLLESAEVCSALGDVYLRIVWDNDVTDHPMLDVVHADHAIPEFRFRRLTAVTFWRVVQIDGSGTIWRHLERYEPGLIQHGLYVGKRDALGRKVDLGAHPSTAGLEDDIHLPGILSDQLLVRHVPNVRPNRRHRNLPIGRADTAGLEPFMDGLDETYTAWVREIRLVKPRILVPAEFLDRRGRGAGASFNVDNDIFSPLEMDPKSQEKAGVTVAEFMLHTEDYSRTCMAFFERIISTAGYSGSTFGLQTEGGGELTATEIRAKENLTLRTTNRKGRYWRQPSEEAAELLLVVDKELFQSKVTPMRPRLELADGLPDDPRQTATTIELLRRAQAISIETGIRMAQPHLKGEELQAEIDRVMGETGMAVPDPAVIGQEGEGL